MHETEDTEKELQEAQEKGAKERNRILSQPKNRMISNEDFSYGGRSHSEYR